ncbi:hypothetical protein [Flagellimonas allohymeniacidonis]|uniref:Uncharacterized protein n=1 Tax=Flagellimonas allohymeniacidonis TaxID=2517819 RepID=A0A4Q8QGU5_9FLAO|nr:hypothetical protein [Allomuricauda hymeniacidonis]TAI49721.1 hypothetical protein EW142_07970 [Allomuricauda hymeniacidonis]
MAGSIFIRAKHRGTRRYKRKAWKQHFSYGRSKFYALVHNAAYDFYDRAVRKFGIHHPNQSWLRISARYYGELADSRHNDLNINGGFAWVPLLGWKSEIQVGRLSQGKYEGSDKIYGIVAHEMAHASHYRMDRYFFLNVRFLTLKNRCKMRTISESWAEGVETVVTNDRFQQLSNNYKASPSTTSPSVGNFYNSRFQALQYPSISEYTPIVADLSDSFNQRTINGSSNKNRPDDRVHGYTLNQIQRALKTSRSSHDWKERLKSLYNNSTEHLVDALFNEYMYDRCQ